MIIVLAIRGLRKPEHSRQSRASHGGDWPLPLKSRWPPVPNYQEDKSVHRETLENLGRSPSTENNPDQLFGVGALTDFGHHWFHVARVHDHSPLPVPWWCLQCQMRWSTRRPLVSSAVSLWITCQPSSPSWVLDITFLIAHLCVARSVWHWEPWACLAHWRRADRSPRISPSQFPRRSLSLTRMPLVSTR